MPTPVPADRFLRALRDEGVKVVEVSGWMTRNRNHVGTWGPVHGVMIHHTVTGPKVNAVAMCRDGLSRLPGPLCHGVIRRDGTVHLIGYGRANHAGGGDINVLSAVIGEGYGQTPPAPHQHQGSPGAVDGNAHFMGFECENLGDGRDPWTAAQLDAIERASAAVCRLYGWSAKSVIGHLEWSDHKSDPRGFTMAALRAKIATRLSRPAGWTQAPAPKPSGGTAVTAPLRMLLSRSEDMTLVQDIPQTIYWTTEHADTANGHGEGGKTAAVNAQYSAILNLSISGLNAGEAVDVYPVEEDSTGGFMGAGDAHSIPGNGGVGAAPVKVNVPFIGSVGQRLAFQVVNRQETPVTLTFARLVMQTWAN